MKTTFKALFMAIAILAMSSVMGLAQDLQKGLEAAEKGDFATALREWRPLAEQGDAQAQYGLGVMYDNGYGVTQDDKEAANWYRKAAEQGYAAAQFNLAVMYDKGRGVTQDDAEAANWTRKAAEQGHASAQVNLGKMYDLGQGALLDTVYAHMWWNIAASSGNASAKKNRDIAEKKMTAAQLAEAQKLARECVKKEYKGC